MVCGSSLRMIYGELGPFNMEAFWTLETGPSSTGLEDPPV